MLAANDVVNRLRALKINCLNKKLRARGGKIKKKKFKKMRKQLKIY